jgi:triacylglycerol lipase
VHGIIAHDRKSVINFWGRIPKVLKDEGINVFRGNTDAWGGYESNALILKKTIEEILAQTRKEKVNIIAHSKGGIDSRYLIYKHNFADKIASLTTVCTPHRGSEIADFIINQKIIHTKFTKSVLRIFGKLYGDANPDLYDVNYLLTTARMKEFNEKVIMDEKVFYQSLYTTMSKADDDLAFYYPYSYIKKISGDNDGMVSEYSTSWGNNVSKIDGSISHGQILDLRGKNVRGINIPDVYVNIVRKLSVNGF